jgi:4'-phosphopantetheinyl transferase
MAMVRCTWREAVLPERLPLGEVHVWRERIGEPSPCAEGLLSADERRRADRLLRQEDRWRFVQARAALRTILARYCGAGPDAIVLREGRNGKPELERRPSCRDICFNLSHSGELALLAFAVGTPVGVDVEAVRPIPEEQELAQRFLTASERLALGAVRDRESAFLRIWTLKEALLKATGEGLGGLEQVEVDLSESGARICRPSSCWAARLLEPAPGYVGALVHAA